MDEYITVGEAIILEIQFIKEKLENGEKLNDKEKKFRQNLMDFAEVTMMVLEDMEAEQDGKASVIPIEKIRQAKRLLNNIHKKNFPFGD